jgi:fructose-bisphosphate aldolase / 2-amino-3,7-dideoxy-D-threo-hept-6-ulosonate synthase
VTRMVDGKSVRMARITRHGKMLCVPMDHGVSDGPIKGLDTIQNTIRSVEQGGASAILTHKGILRSLAQPPNLGLIMHVSASTKLGPSLNRKVLVGGVLEALQLGADAVSLHANIGGNEEAEMLEQLGIIARDCDEYRVPFIAMMYPRGEGIKNPSDPEIVAHVARIGAELGADIVKTVYTGDPDSFRRVVRSCPTPVVLAGGPKSENELEALEMAEGAMEAGAIGVTFGRNVFQHENPQAMVKALGAVVYDARSARDALELVRSATVGK